jgi:hypothetical protein
VAPDGTATIAQSPEDLRASVTAQIVEGKPTFFKLEAQLPKRGRSPPRTRADVLAERPGRHREYVLVFPVEPLAADHRVAGPLEHVNSGDRPAFLFSFSDAPVMKALSL